MQKIIFLFVFLLCESAFANLYLTTEYQEAGKPIIATKHHIFLNKKYYVNYHKMAYTLTLTKIEKDRGTIETETFVINNKGRRELSAGGIADFSLSKSIQLEQYSKSGKREFMLRIIPEKIVL